MEEQKKPKDVSKYKEYYSDSKFWNKVKSLGKEVLKPSILLYYVMKSPEIPINIKMTIAGALGYLILPLDMIPDFIPLTGYSDDAAALLAIIKMCSKYITPDIKVQAEEKLNTLLKIKANKEE